MTPVETELQHMQILLSASRTSFRGWRQYMDHKAQMLAAKDPEFERLPKMLEVEMARLREHFKATSTPGEE